MALDPQDVELTPAESAVAEYGLAILALGAHRRTHGWEPGPDGQRERRHFCVYDSRPWPCPTCRWALKRINAATTGQPGIAPVSPAPCEAFPSDVDIDELLRRLTSDQGNGHSPDDDAAP